MTIVISGAITGALAFGILLVLLLQSRLRLIRPQRQRVIHGMLIFAAGALLIAMVGFVGVTALNLNPFATWWAGLGLAHLLLAGISWWNRRHPVVNTRQKFHVSLWSSALVGASNLCLASSYASDAAALQVMSILTAGVLLLAALMVTGARVWRSPG